MTTVAGAWTDGQLEEFLTESRIPIRLGTRRGDGSLWIVALWYRYRAGTIECATRATADIVDFLDADPAVGFDISTNKPPYRGVRGHGHATMEPDDDKATLRALIERYLGGTDSTLADWLLDDAHDEIRIRIQPEELYTWDFSDRMADIDTESMPE